MKLKKYNNNEISIVEHVRGQYVEEFIDKHESEVVIVDNYSEEMMTIDNLLKLINGGTFRLKEFKPKIVYISCLYHPDRCLQVYNSKKLTKNQQQKIEVLKERITTLMHLQP